MVNVCFGTVVFRVVCQYAKYHLLILSVTIDLSIYLTVLRDYGLRNGKVIRAPEWFLDKLPKFPLDGELWSGHQSFEQTASIIKTIGDTNSNGLSNDSLWQKIQYHIFDSPPLHILLSPGTIGRPGDIYYKEIHSAAIDWAMDKMGPLIGPKYLEFDYVYNWLKQQNCWNEYVCLLEQTQLPCYREEYQKIINQKLQDVVIAGGEGLMIRKDQSYWCPERSHNLLKIKKWYDDEAIVTGYVWGRKTARGSKLMGKMGAMVVQWKDKLFEISGFDFEERKLVLVNSGQDAVFMGQILAGKTVDTSMIFNPKFPIGSKVTFRYRDLTTNGIPKNAQFHRIPTSL